MKRCPAVFALCVAAATLTDAVDARAWYFPEHAAIEHDGLTQLPPELRAVLAEAVRRARADGLELCEQVDVALDNVEQARPLETRMLRAQRGAGCVPYVVLSAIAGDHASSAAELRSILTTAKGIELTSAAAYEWGRFQRALDRLPNAPLERMSFVHALDVAFYFIDPGYELRAQATQAHFTLGGQSLTDAVQRSATSGSSDSALGQFLAHHLRSLQLASQGRVSEAILEHAFAMHFLQDAFAAGHLVMTEETWKSGNAHARRRHDFFNAKGLAVRRALSAASCATLGAGLMDRSGLSPCWVTTGDGYLGTSPDASDRQHAALAITKAELFFALALDPKRVVAAIEALDEREQLVLGRLVEPAPWWTLLVAARRDLPASAARTRRLVRAAVSAVRQLQAGPEVRAVDVGSPPRAGLFANGLLDGAISPCAPAGQVDPSLFDDSDRVPCDADRALAVGTAGVSLVRPLLVDLPESQVDAMRLEGQSKEDLGWAAQLLASANASALFPAHAPVDFFAPSVGVAAGVAYRWGTYLPGRLNRSVVELNVGISAALQVDSHGSGGVNPHVTMLDQELRWPVLWELLTSYTLPLDLAKGHTAGQLVFLSGGRVHEVVTPTTVFFGLELEVVALALTPGSGSYPLYTASPELRLYLGAADPSAAQPFFPGTWGPTVGVELTGGYATFF